MLIVRGDSALSIEKNDSLFFFFCCGFVYLSLLLALSEAGLAALEISISM